MSILLTHLCFFVCGLLLLFYGCSGIKCFYYPGWGPRRKQVCPDRRWTHEGGVVRSKYSLETSKNARKSGHERTKVCRTHESLDMNTRKSEHERRKIGKTHESWVNARKSGHERTKVWTWTHESLVNARKSGHERTKVWWTHESLVMNARKSVERTKVWTWTHESLNMNAGKLVKRMKVGWTHESLDMNARIVWWTHESLDMNARKSGERTKVWTWTHESLVNARKSGHERTKVWRTHESLDIGNFRLGRSGHRYFPSGTVWTYLLPSGTSTWVLVLNCFLLSICCNYATTGVQFDYYLTMWSMPVLLCSSALNPIVYLAMSKSLRSRICSKVISWLVSGKNQNPPSFHFISLHFILLHFMSTRT